MSDFTHALKRTLNPGLPMGSRYRAFIECCGAFARLAGTSMQEVHDCLGDALGFSREHKPDSAQLTAAGIALMATRFRLLHTVHSHAAACLRAKLLGRRRPSGDPLQGLAPLQMLIEEIPPCCRPGDRLPDLQAHEDTVR